MFRIMAGFASVPLMLAASPVWAQTTTPLPGYGIPPAPTLAGTPLCPRPAPGSTVLPPPDIFSQHGLLSVQINYNTSLDTSVTPNRTLFCFQQASTGWEAPTLRINPGDTLSLTVTNNVPASGTVVETVSTTNEQCGSLIRTPETMNIHYHGAPVSPACGQDQVIHTMIDSGQTFQYFIPWPTFTPPGMYWWHHHVHGNADPAVKGGASSALIVGGIQNFFPWLTGMRERVLVIRDQNLVSTAVSLAAGAACPGTDGSDGQVVAGTDHSINYVPLNTGKDCTYTPAVMETLPLGFELWRVANASADTPVDLTLLDQNGNEVPLTLVALDGVPTGSELAHQLGTPVTTDDVLIAPAGRAEFVVPVPTFGQTWSFVANHFSFAGGLGGEVVGGPAFEGTQTRTLAQVKASLTPTILPLIPLPTTLVPPSIPASQKLINQKPTVFRSFFFDEPPAGEPPSPEALANGIPNKNANFIMAVVNQDGTINETPFDVSNPPAVVSTQGTIEQWTVANHTEESHEFHFHQLRFLVLSQDNFPVDPATGKPYPFGVEAPYEVGQYMDMIQVPAAPDTFFSPSGGLFPNYTPPAGASPPSVTFRLDFTGSDIGDFVFHCHILGHEDAGMMQIIRVVPPVAP